MKLLIHSQTSTVQLLKFGKGWVISSHTSLGIVVIYPYWDYSSFMLVKGTPYNMLDMLKHLVKVTAAYLKIGHLLITSAATDFLICSICNNDQIQVRIEDTKISLLWCYSHFCKEKVNWNQKVWNTFLTSGSDEMFIILELYNLQFHLMINIFNIHTYVINL